MDENKTHMGNLPYNVSTLAELCSIKVIISELVLDDKIVLMDFTGNRMSIWDKKTGDIHGTCSLDEAHELHVSQFTYDQLTSAVAAML